jgi:3-mercaptopropionate dioxygenase
LRALKDFLSNLVDYSEMHDLLEMKNECLLPQGSAEAAFDAFCQFAVRTTAGLPERDVPAHLATMLPTILCHADLLTTAQREAPDTGYVRHTLFICPEDRFSIMSVVWSAGVFSPIHDHSNWCAFGVYEGAVEETVYEAVCLPAGPPKDMLMARVAGSELHLPGSVGHMPAAATHIHRMHNPGRLPAISIHVYGGNCEKTGPNIDRVYRARS